VPVYELEGVAPRIDADAFVHPDAIVIGDVTIGPESSIWPGAVLRGDYGTITVGAGSSLQDGTVVHAGPGFPTVIGDGCVVGHLVHLEGCTLHDESLAGSGSVVLHWAVIGRGATVGANAVVPNHTVVPPGALALGVPAKVFEDRSDVAMIRVSAAEYVHNAKRYRSSLRRLDRD
jgi:carbonic anhydrase/acetyltransferase-like protein (isoleucine patch superfamily)